MRQTGWMLAFLLVIGLAALAPATQGGRADATTSSFDGAVRTFGALSAMHAWALIGADLLLTEDGGTSWRQATPPGAMMDGPVAVAFLDPAAGWVAMVALT